MNYLRWLAAFTFATIAGTSAFGATDYRVSAILFVASAEDKPSDAKLTRFEAELKRILRFQSFKFVGEGAATPDRDGKLQITPSAGHKIQLKLDSSKERRVGMTLLWHRDERLVLDQAVSPHIGKPTIFIGPAADGSGAVFGLIVIVE